ncbi:MAG: hypothetical protein ACO3M5_11575 [Saprospiraceae bacterium]|jgi:hypothetical protein|nr:hypothetical protein [Chitinophagia bacterium]
MTDEEKVSLIESFLDGTLRTRNLEQFKLMLEDEGFARDCLLMAVSLDALDEQEVNLWKEKLKTWRKF